MENVLQITQFGYQDVWEFKIYFDYLKEDGKMLALGGVNTGSTPNVFVGSGDRSRSDYEQPTNARDL